jgi:hypothetical protein
VTQEIAACVADKVTECQSVVRVTLWTFKMRVIVLGIYRNQPLDV